MNPVKTAVWLPCKFKKWCLCPLQGFPFSWKNQCKGGGLIQPLRKKKKKSFYTVFSSKAALAAFSQLRRLTLSPASWGQVSAPKMFWASLTNSIWGRSPESPIFLPTNQSKKSVPEQKWWSDCLKWLIRLSASSWAKGFCLKLSTATFLKEHTETST